MITKQEYKEVDSLGLTLLKTEEIRMTMVFGTVSIAGVTKVPPNQIGYAFQAN